ncbi:YczE/YyaS/YitT family protein [Pontibacillus yanchengensis]|uniref:BCR, YitT family n=1 Tax=Pontibacillus yanchengensis Y32 TaxID=1385514 RepID=A0A0A2TQA4_9BACI|nr:membrane protein [Pontibacillus yanchengensis]KGP71485.1 BCR, YitT family [Pontibacillus yanchengensis Y32]
MSNISQMYNHYLGNRNKKIQFVLYLFGIIISSLGLALLFKSGVGVAPGDTVAFGLAERTNIKVGYFLIAGFVALVLINAKIAGQRPKFESIIPSLLRGLTLNVWLYQILGESKFEVWWAQWGIFGIGVIFLGLGIGMYLRSPFPHIPVDHFMMVVNEKTNSSKRFVRILFEAGLALIGFLLGGWDVVGIGTLITALFLGPIIQFFYDITEFIERLGAQGRHKSNTALE